LAVRKLTGSLGIAVASMGAAVGIALTSATPAVAANQALMLNGIGLNISGGLLPDIVMSQVLGGMFGSYQRTAVGWPMQARPVTGPDSLTLTESVAVGVDNLDAAIKTALTKTGPDEHVTVVGLSAGALVADDQLRRLLTDPNAPDKNKLSFVVVADSSRANFNKNRFDKTLNYQYRVPVATKYDTIVVTAEYDGFADFPDRLWNVVAVANAYAGEILNHVPSVFTDLSTVPERNITVTTNSLGGKTTNYFVPSANLPLVELLPFLEPQADQLKKIVDAGYIRNDPKSAAPTPAAAVAVAAEALAPANAVTEPAPAVRAPAEPVVNKQQAPEPEPETPDPAVDQGVGSASPVTAERSPAAQREPARAAKGAGIGHRSSEAVRGPRLAGPSNKLSRSRNS